MKKNFTTYSKKTTFKGILRGNKRGFAFLIREDGGNDIFLPHSALKGAQHGDTVIVRLIRGDEGEVEKIVERGVKTVVGTVKKEKNRILLLPDDECYYSDVTLLERKDLKNGQKAAAEIIEYPKGKLPRAKVTKILGKSGDRKAEELSCLYSYGFTEGFGKEAENYAAKLSITDKDYEGREDFRKLTTITVDGDDAKDFDDAISVVSVKGGGFTLYVHIADVSNFVTPRNPIDDEAYARTTSVYFPGKAYPMLPEALCNNLCSLLPEEDRLTLTAVMDFTATGIKKQCRVVKSVIRSDYRMTYSKVKAILSGDEELCKQYKPIKGFLENASALAALLSAQREKRGSVDFTTKETCVILTKDGVELAVKEADIATSMIEEFMLAANETVAEILTEKGYPCVYRVHKQPDPDKLKALQLYAEGFGFEFGAKALKPEDVADFIKAVKNTEYGEFISTVGIRSMQKAEYSVENIGHFGLAAKCYCHFTSPIRRYPDLIQHRMVKLMLEGKNPEELNSQRAFNLKAAGHSSQMERAAERAERDMVDYYKALYMTNHIGESYEGIVSGVTQSGIFVILPNSVEGFVGIDYLPKDTYYYDSSRYLLKGERGSYSLGSPIKVTAAFADVASRRVDFRLSD